MSPALNSAMHHNRGGEHENTGCCASSPVAWSCLPCKMGHGAVECGAPLSNTVPDENSMSYLQHTCSHARMHAHSHPLIRSHTTTTTTNTLRAHTLNLLNSFRCCCKFESVFYLDKLVKETGAGVSSALLGNNNVNCRMKRAATSKKITSSVPPTQTCGTIKWKQAFQGRAVITPLAL